MPRTDDGRLSGVVYTSDVPPGRYRDPSIAATAHLFQAKLVKTADLRVTVVGDDVFATEIRNPDELDWRRSHDSITYRSCELPDTVVAGVHRLMRSLNLFFGALDFVLTDQGHQFIEINPNGQWGWIEHQTGQPHFPCPGGRVERDSVGGDSGVTDTTTDSDQTRVLRREMVTALVNDGTLADDRWRDAFLSVPRHMLVPAYYQAGTHIDGETDRERWLRLVYSDTTLVTQRRPDAVTSSGTMPSLVAMMVQALEVQDGDRVLQVGTGTGYTAALLCERLGSAQVTSIDVDPDLTTAARGRLRSCGYVPFVSPPTVHAATPNVLPTIGSSSPSR